MGNSKTDKSIEELLEEFKDKGINIKLGKYLEVNVSKNPSADIHLGKKKSDPVIHIEPGHDRQISMKIYKDTPIPSGRYGERKAVSNPKMDFDSLRIAYEEAPDGTYAQRSLRRKLFEYAVTHDMDKETAYNYFEPELKERDHMLSSLKNPLNHSDEEIFKALAFFSDGKLSKSAVLDRDEEKGKHLFASLWRYMANTCVIEGSDLFTLCFGWQKVYPWHPLYTDSRKAGMPNYEYMLNDCRSYIYSYGKWSEKRYEKLYFDKESFNGILHEGDRLFRKYLKAGHHLREKDEEAWVTPYAKAIINGDIRAEEEAKKPVIKDIDIDFSELDKIREDAAYTRDSLLTEDELEIEENEVLIPEVSLPQDDSILNEVQREIVKAVLFDGSAKEVLKAHGLMPSIAADDINEVLIEEIGDSPFECDGDDIYLVEDYRDDLLRILKGE